MISILVKRPKANLDYILIQIDEGVAGRD